MKKNILKINVFIILFLGIICLFSMNNVYGFSEGDTVIVTSKNGAYHYKVNPYAYGYAGAGAVENNYIRDGSGNKFENGTILKFSKDKNVENICEVEFKGKNYYVKKGNLSKKVSSESAAKSAKQKFYDTYASKQLAYYNGLGASELLSLSESWHEYNKQINPTFTGLEATNWTNINNNINKAAESKGRKIVNGQVERTALDTAENGATKVQNDINDSKLEGDANAGITTAEEGGSTLYENQPKKETTSSSGDSLDDLMSDADSFVDSANSDGVGTVDSTALQDFSNTFYNIVLTIGVVVAVIVGIIIGIKFMTSSVEEKADIKQLLVPYLIGCIVVFGGFAIWKLIVTILQEGL